jgi:hypothetical protein
MLSDAMMTLSMDTTAMGYQIRSLLLPITFFPFRDEDLIMSRSGPSGPSATKHGEDEHETQQRRRIRQELSR